MSCDVVVAQYQENIDWLKLLRHNYIRDIHLYKKSKQSKIFTRNSKPINPKIKQKTLPNIGRESHTYLNYCVEYYENLPDFVFFLQGNPQAHGLTTNHILRWMDIISRQPSKKHTNNFGWGSMFLGLENGRRPVWAGSNCTPSEFDMESWFKHYVCPESEINLHRCKICFGANFGVSKDRILSREKSFYQILMEKELSSINPESGHYMERSWFYIFNLQQYD